MCYFEGLSSDVSNKSVRFVLVSLVIKTAFGSLLSYNKLVLVTFSPMTVTFRERITKKKQPFVTGARLELRHDGSLQGWLEILLRAHCVRWIWVKTDIFALNCPLK